MLNNGVVYPRYYTAHDNLHASNFPSLRAAIRRTAVTLYIY